jgi:hypothetical protein
MPATKKLHTVEASAVVVGDELYNVTNDSAYTVARIDVEDGLVRLYDAKGILLEAPFYPYRRVQVLR